MIALFAILFYFVWAWPISFVGRRLADRGFDHLEPKAFVGAMFLLVFTSPFYAIVDIIKHGWKNDK